MTTATIKNPRDGRVKSVEPGLDKPVHCGQLLLTLDDSPERKYLAQINSERNALLSQLSTLGDQVVTAEVNRLQSAYDAYTFEEDNATTAFKMLYGLFSLGQTDCKNVLQHHDKVLQARYQKLKTHAQLAKLAKDADISRRYIQQAIDELDEEEDYVQRKLAQLSVKAPIDGRLQLFVGPGDPVKRGFLLGTIDS